MGEIAEEGEKRIVSANYYMVAVLDLLGQKEAMKKFKGLPDVTDENKMGEFYAICKETFGAIDGLHTFTKSFLTRFLEKRRKDDVVPYTDIKFQRFSDGLVMFVSLRVTKNEVPVQAVYGALGACGAHCLAQLALGRPLRGGVEVGVGVELNENELYGPVIAEAFSLESEVAQYPRIVIGDNLGRYLTSMKESRASDPYSIFASEMASCCLEFFARDIDGQIILDYLGEGFIKQTANKLDRKLFAMALEFTEKQLEKWRGERNSTLAIRYNLLRNYYESRKHFWKDG